MLCMMGQLNFIMRQPQLALSKNLRALSLSAAMLVSYTLRSMSIYADSVDFLHPVVYNKQLPEYQLAATERNRIFRHCRQVVCT